MIVEKPAPWELTGDAYIMLYRFSKEFVFENGFLEDFQKNRFLGYFGAVVLVDYHSSDVGPYQELLFIPGMFTFDWQKVFSISKIYVSTLASAENGQENWGIPKEIASFKWDNYLEKKTEVLINTQEKAFFSAEFKEKYCSIPFKSSIFPFKIVQRKNDDLLLTQPSFSGDICITSVKKIMVNHNYFPDISKVNPLITFKLKNFVMKFPSPTVKKKYF